MNIVLSVDSIERLRFFKRIILGSSDDVNFFVVTHLPLVFLYLKSINSSNVKIYFIKGDRHKDHLQQRMHDPSLELLTNKLDKNEELTLFKSYLGELESIFSNPTLIDYILVWNGQQLLNTAFATFARQCSIEVIYMEISNFFSKMFIDSEGVNAKSYIYSNSSDLDKFPTVDNEKHQAWLFDYIQRKNNILPQSQASTLDIIERAVNKLLFSFVSPMHTKFVFRTMLNSRPKPVNFNSYEFDEISGLFDVVFCPLQVSTDTQLLVNSDYNNLDQINQALDISSRKSKTLVVKLHPAETDKKSVDRIFQMRKKYGFKIVNSSVKDIFDVSSEVIVNNSTVGLEAMLFGLDTTVIGRAIYSEFNKERLISYIHNYLLSGVDYFSEDVININLIVEHSKKQHGIKKC
ncbi:putative Capsular biosynthesis protein [Vibrio chagasii]|nr:putative Capsular biosynthesis protein [Vibrio chagasii]